MPPATNKSEGKVNLPAEIAKELRGSLATRQAPPLEVDRVALLEGSQLPDATRARLLVEWGLSCGCQLSADIRAALAEAGITFERPSADRWSVWTRRRQARPTPLPGDCGTPTSAVDVAQEVR